MSFGDGTFGSGTFADSVSLTVLDEVSDAGSTDIVSIVARRQLGIVDSAEVSDSTALSATRSVQLIESAGSVDVLDVAQQEGLTDDAGSADSAAVIASRVVQLIESAGSADAVSALRHSDLIDDTDSTDTLSLSAGIHRFAADDVEALDDFALTRSQSTVDSAGASDATIVGFVRQRAFTDTAGARDTLTVDGLPAVLDTFMSGGVELGADWIVVKDAPLIVNPRHGNRERDWTAATFIAVSHCSVQPFMSVGTRSGGEFTEDREFTLTHMRLFAPPDTALSATSRVVFNGVTYEVDGEPARWRDLDGRPSHIEAALKRLTG